MIIVIDGYNFLKLVIGTTFVSDSQMSYWINYFQDYVDYRGNKIIIVLDAGPYTFQSYQKHGSVDVWYSGQYQTADDWIKNWLLKNKHKDILLVSSDREIRDFADGLNIVSIVSQEFYKIVDNLIEESKKEYIKESSQVFIKTKGYESSDRYLDSLMEMGSRDIVSVYKENDYTQKVDRNSKSKQESKIDKIFLKKINKI